MQSPIHQVYNDGVVTFSTKEPNKDKFGTPIGGQATKKVWRKYWFKDIWMRSEEVVAMASLGTKETKKIAVDGKQQIDSSMIATIGGVDYEIFSCNYSERRDRTELSLVLPRTKERKVGVRHDNN